MADREAAAYHEAGHCVTAQRLGFAIESATIVPSRLTQGQFMACDEALFLSAPGSSLFSGLRVGGREMQQAEAAAAVWLAGYAAQKRLDGAADSATSALDCAYAATLLLYAHGGDEDAARNHYHAVAWQAGLAVDDAWPAVERVAAALIERGSLTGGEIARLLARVCAEA